MRSLRLPVLTLACAALAGVVASRAQPAPGAPDWSQAETVEIDLTNFAFAPAQLQLKPGVVYRLRFVNKTSGGHDFTAKAFFDAAAIDPEDEAAVHNGMVMLAGNKSADIRLMAPKAGRYEARCTHFMHAGLGMKGEVIVQ